MTEEQKKVLKFHKKFDCISETAPKVPEYSLSQLRLSLIHEELDELEEAFDQHCIVSIADALGDLLYVVYGAGISCGVDLEPVFNEIHRSNMSKTWPDGSVHRNDLGKVVKPDSYSPANLAPILADQSYREQENLTNGQ